ncbi:MAG: anaerobic ribonucleoside-triphosphate reductase activating protein [Halanaerobium sp.]
MKIGGLQKTSAIDYPGQLTAILFTQGCNLKCPYCHNPELISIKSDSPEFDKEKFFSFLEKRKNILDAVTITGGEPTLQKDLIPFIKKIKEMNYLIKLDSNGLKPKILNKLINHNLLDYLAVDIKLPAESYSKLDAQMDLAKIKNNLQATIEIIEKAELDYEFRTTVVTGFHSKSSFERTVKQIKGSQNYYIQNFRPHKTLNKSFEKKRRFTEKELNEFKEIAKKYVKNVYIRD